MANNFVHMELNTTDPEKAKAFYGQLFPGWKLAGMQGAEDDYTLIAIENGVGGGIMKHPMPGAPSIWSECMVWIDSITSSAGRCCAGSRCR